MHARIGAVFAALVLTLATAVTGCAPRVRPATSAALPAAMSCDPLPGDGRPAPIAFLLTESVSFDRAPEPGNDSERLVFRQLYETLVTLDCAGNPHPALAESWTSADSGRVWTFTLRNDAHFWDGTPILPADIQQSWIDARARHDGTSRRLPWTWFDPRSDSVAALDNRRLEVRGQSRLGESLQLFADPALAVVHRRVGVIPLGSGPYQPIDLLAIDEGRGWDLTCAAVGGPAGDRRVVQFRIRPGVDPRDLAPRDRDALLVRDRSLVDYLVAAGGVDAIPLGWDRLYLLVAPRSAGGSPRPAPEWLGDDDRAELAREVVVSDAEPARSIAFADSIAIADSAPGSCPGVPGSSGSPAPHPAGNRIVYASDDVDSRRLAERLAALAGMHGGLDSGGLEIDPDARPATARDAPASPARAMSAAPQAAGLENSAFTASLLEGNEAAYVLRIDRRHAAACLEIAELLDIAPWLRPGDVSGSDLASTAPGGAAGAIGPTVIALVRTRPALVVRRGLVGIGVDVDGALRLGGAGWAAGGAADP